MEQRKIGIVAVVYFCLFVFNSFDAYSDEILDDEESTRHNFYVSPEIMIGNYWGLGVNFTYTYDHSYSFQIGTSWMAKKAANLPNDYYTFTMFTVPHDHLTHIHIALGMMIYLNELETIRLNLSAGVASTSICEPRNFVKLTDGEVTEDGENYTYQHFEYDKVSLVALPSLQFLIQDNIGIYISPSYIYNSDRSFSGVKLGVMLGKIK